MSIWASTFSTKNEWTETGEDAPPRTLDYNGSHVLPNKDSADGGNIHCAIISKFVRYHRENPEAIGGGPDGIEPYLRFELEGYEEGLGNSITQILKVETVEALRDYFTQWLEEVRNNE